MVNGISGQNSNYSAFYRAAAGNAIVNQNDVKNMVNFLNGQPITVIPEPSIGEMTLQTLPFAAAFGGVQAFSTWKNNGLDGKALEAFKEAKKNGTAKGYNLKETIKNIKTTYPYTQRNEALKSGLDNLKKEYGEILKNNVTPNESRAPFGIYKLLDKIPGYTKLRSTGIGKAMGKSGAGWMLVFDTVGKTLSDIVPTFQQLGFSSGMKQIAKSGTQIIAGGAGWLAGDALGTALGTAIGTAICPGIGTAIGGFFGKFLGGVVGSAIAGKAAKAITGKNELEQAQEQQMEQITQQVDSDPNTKLALAQETLAAAEEILAQDPNNQNAQTAKKSAEKVINELHANIQQPAQQTTTQQQGAQNNVFQQTTMNGIPVVPGFNGIDYDMNIYRSAMANAAMPMGNQPMLNPLMYNQAGANIFNQPVVTQEQTTQTTK